MKEDAGGGLVSQADYPTGSGVSLRRAVCSVGMPRWGLFSSVKNLVGLSLYRTQHL